MPPVINEENCSCCGTCSDVCAEDVFFGSLANEPPQVTYPDECVYCNGCIEECPGQDAIHLRIPLPMMLMYRPV